MEGQVKREVELCAVHLDRRDIAIQAGLQGARQSRDSAGEKDAVAPDDQTGVAQARDVLRRMLFP